MWKVSLKFLSTDDDDAEDNNNNAGGMTMAFMFQQTKNQRTIKPFVWHWIKSSVQLAHGDGLGVDYSVYNLLEPSA